MSGFTSFAKALGYTAEEAELVAAGFNVHKASPDPADVAVAAPSVRRRRKRAVPLAKAAAWKPLALGGAAAYGTTTTLSDDDTKYVRVKRFHSTVMPKLAQRQRDWNYNRKQI